MQMRDEIRIAAPRARVFEALNDPAILRQCIPGCEELEQVSDNELAATVTAKVGPVKAKFNGAVTLSDIVAPESYTITGQGKGGAAGFAKGGARVQLAEDGDGTLLSYDVNAEVGGKIAQLGGRLIDAAARSFAKDFFGKFKELVEGPADEAAAGEPAAPVPEAPQPAGGLQRRVLLLFAAAILAAILAYILA
jgi:hypothetical protein